MVVSVRIYGNPSLVSLKASPSCISKKQEVSHLADGVTSLVQPNACRSYCWLVFLWTCHLAAPVWSSVHNRRGNTGKYGAQQKLIGWPQAAWPCLLIQISFYCAKMWEKIIVHWNEQMLRCKFSLKKWIIIITTTIKNNKHGTNFKN